MKKPDMTKFADATVTTIPTKGWTVTSNQIVGIQWVEGASSVVPATGQALLSGPYVTTRVRRLQMGRTATEFDANGGAIRQYTHWEDVPTTSNKEDVPTTSNKND